MSFYYASLDKMHPHLNIQIFFLFIVHLTFLNFLINTFDLNTFNRLNTFLSYKQVLPGKKEIISLFKVTTLIKTHYTV